MTVKRVAVYGKGGIGKSTISSNLTASLSDKGKRVMQIGCDPKHDSTRLLISGKEQRTVLEYLRDTKEEERRLEDVIKQGYKGCICVEAGGPEPGVGCAGRGIISAFGLLDALGINDVELDIVTYDVLGDVVCGGFAVPLRNDYADIVYIVTSGEFMSIYAANNILRGTANYNPDRIGGIIFNSRGDEEEKERVKRFSDAVGIPIIAEFARSKIFLQAEQLGRTVVEAFPDSDIAKQFSDLAEKVILGNIYTAKFLSEAELEKVVLERSVIKRDVIEQERTVRERPAAKRCVPGGRSRRSDKEVVHGCAFAGTMCVTLSVDGLATVLHAPRDCAHYAVQMVTNAMRRSFTNGDIPIRPFARPNVRCSEMDDPDMIFGSVDSLEAAISDTIRGGNRTIAVVTSCPSGIIGEDIGGMIERISKEHTDVTLIPIIEDGNIKGDYMQGATDACLRLIRGLSEKGKKERSVNLVGVKTFGINTLGNIEFMSSVLKRLNVKVNCTCVGNTSVSEIQNIPNASLCVLMTPDTIATETMDLLRNEFGLKATANTARPGMMETELLIRELGEHFSEEERAERLIGELRREYADRLGMLRPRLINKKIYIVGMKRDIGWLMETAVGAGMNVVRCVVIDITDRSEMNDLENVYGTEMIPAGIKSNLKRMKDRTERILDPYIPVDPEMNAWIKNDLRERMPDLLLSTYPIDEKIRTCFLDVNPDTTPFAGPDFASLWSRTIRTPSKEGWKEDVI